MYFSSYTLIGVFVSSRRLRICTAADFDSFKKLAAHFLNTVCDSTEPKNAAYADAVGD